ncbi:MAG: ABC transporter ATP-binding protein [Deltaproteobacteria bacterium]|jgi:iron complex transport system ATP-binding protein|nr:ABC transporter ATP-binding protein [Deltaproteobacteria bacterium]
MEFSALNITCGYGKKAVIKDFSLKLGASEVICLLGPNGVGKTTVFKTLMGFLRPLKGTVILNGYELREIKPVKRARLLAYVPQRESSVFSFTVQDVVLMGRSAYFGFFQRPSKADRDLALSVLERLGLSGLKDRSFSSLSGGERQLVLIARALCQEPEFLLLDEPTSSLDFHNQLRVLSLIKELAGNGLGILMTTHMPDHVFMCGTSAAILGKDGFCAIGPLSEVMTVEKLSRAYGIEIKIFTLNGNGSFKVCRAKMDSLAYVAKKDGLYDQS